MRCKICQYSLNGLTEHRCPECGNPFDLNNPNTYDDPSIPKPLSVLCLVLIGTATWVLTTGIARLSPEAATISLPICVLITFLAYRVQESFRRPGRKPPEAQELVHCKTCHYSLEHLRGPEHRCPECGRPFDPNDPRTFESGRPGESGLWLLWMALATFAFIAFLLAAAFVLTIWEARHC